MTDWNQELVCLKTYLDGVSESESVGSGFASFYSTFLEAVETNIFPMVKKDSIGLVMWNMNQEFHNLYKEFLNSHPTPSELLANLGRYVNYSNYLDSFTETSGKEVLA